VTLVALDEVAERVSLRAANCPAPLVLRRDLARKRWVVPT